MEIIRGGNGVVLVVVVLLTLAIGSSEGRAWAIHPLFHHGGGLLPPSAMEQHTMGQAWIFCKNKLLDRTERIKFSDDYALQDASDAFKSVLLSKPSIEEAMEALPPLMKQSFMDCLRETNPQLPIPRPKDAISKGWFLKCVDFLHSSWFYFPRRSLAMNQLNPLKDPLNSLHSGHGKTAQSPAPAASPQDPSERSPGPAPAPAPSLQDPSERSPAPAPSIDLAPSSTSSPSPAPRTPAGPSDPPELSEPPHVPPKSSHLPAKSHPAHHQPPPHHPSTKNETDDRWTTIAVAVSATAAATFLFVALIFFFCLRDKKRRVEDAHKDDSPLLKLSLSDHSVGSSAKSHSIGNSSNKDFGATSGKNPSSTNHLSAVSENHDLTMPGTCSVETNAAIAVPPLKLPPGKVAPPHPGPPPPPPPKPRPPPPPKIVRPPPVPLAKASHSQGNSALSNGDDSNGDPEAPKAKLKPFFWDKVMASPDHEMVWHEIKAGSFQFNEEKMESLFGYATDKNKGDRKKDSSTENAVQYVQIIDPKKAQNLSILLKALNVTIEEVCDALEEGTKLPMELLQTLLRMAPTTQEELKLRLYSGHLSQLGPAERFLKVIVDIPFAFKRLEALQFMGIAEEEVSIVNESLETLEVACGKLKNSRLFLKLLEAVLKTGNRMNDGTYRGGAQAFKLDTLLKLSDVRGTDGKTTLLHFVIQEIIRYEGIRAIRIVRESQSISSLKSDESVLEESSPESPKHLCTLGLQVVSQLSTELKDVKKAAIIDADSLAASVAKLENSLVKARELLNTEMTSMDEDSKFLGALAGFVQQMEEEVEWIAKEEKRITALVENTADYFHGNSGKSEGLRLFVIIRDFLLMLDKACMEVRDSGMHMSRLPKKDKSVELTESPSRDNNHPSTLDVRRQLFPGIIEHQRYNSSSDDESDAGDS